MAFSRVSTTARTRPNCPGRRSFSGLGNSASKTIVPVFGVDGPVECGHPTLVRVDRAVGQDQLELQCLLGGGRAPGRPPGEPEVVRLAHGRGDLDRIDGGLCVASSVGSPRPTRLPLVHVEPPDDPAHRRLDGGVGEIQLGLRDRGTSGLDRWPGPAGCRYAGDSSVSLSAASAAATPAAVTCSAARALSRSTCGTAFAWASGRNRATST